MQKDDPLSLRVPTSLCLLGGAFRSDYSEFWFIFRLFFSSLFKRKWLLNALSRREDYYYYTKDYSLIYPSTYLHSFYFYSHAGPFPYYLPVTPASKKEISNSLLRDYISSPSFMSGYIFEALDSFTLGVGKTWSLTKILELFALVIVTLLLKESYPLELEAFASGLYVGQLKLEFEQVWILFPISSLLLFCLVLKVNVYLDLLGCRICIGRDNSSIL